MPERISDNIRKQDLDFILEVNKKAIEIETEVAEQNEDIISSLTEIKKGIAESDKKVEKNLADQDKKLDKITTQIEEANKELFRIQVLFVTGLLSLVIQIIQMFTQK